MHRLEQTYLGGRTSKARSEEAFAAYTGDFGKNKSRWSCHANPFVVKIT
jgi:hypothetical protein